jgi:hypothetical protein
LILGEAFSGRRIEAIISSKNAGTSHYAKCGKVGTVAIEKWAKVIAKLPTTHSTNYRLLPPTKSTEKAFDSFPKGLHKIQSFFQTKPSKCCPHIYHPDGVEAISKIILRSNKSYFAIHAASSLLIEEEITEQENETLQNFTTVSK